MKIMIVIFSLTIVKKIVKKIILCMLILFKFISLDSISLTVEHSVSLNRFTSSKGRLRLIIEIKFSLILDFSFTYFENIIYHFHKFIFEYSSIPIYSLTIDKF